MDSYKGETINSYNLNVLEFSRKYKSMADFKGRPEFERFLSLLQGRKVLDAGSGPGDHAKYFESQGLEVTCIDLSEKMIKICKDQGLDARLMDLEEMDFENNYFDGIWMVTSLIHIKKENVPKVIAKTYDMLKEKGVFHVSVKEGEGERFENDDPITRRFFSYWKEEEFLEITKEKFSPVSLGSVNTKGTTYLDLTFKKI